MNKIITKLTYAIVTVLVITFIFFSYAVSGGARTAHAAAYEPAEDYTSVLDDLSKDSNFNSNDYPINGGNYSLQVIQIAEGATGELFVYVYQPSAYVVNLLATSINISTSGAENPSYRNYKLTLLNCVNALYKYRVEGLKVNQSSVRYYDISSIFRKWYAVIDDKPGAGNTVTEVACEVGQLWAARTNNGEVVYSMTDTETITITDKFIGSVRYPNGVSWFTAGACDGHFVAFSTDRRIDKLLEADVTFVITTYDRNLLGTKYGEPEPKDVTLSYDQTASNTVNGIFAKTYKWNRIQSVNDFTSGKEFSDEAKAQISKQQWVLNFYETECKVGIGGATAIVTGLWGTLIGATLTSGTLLSEVSILRLKFETDGITYNLGVIDNKQTGENKPVGKPEEVETGVFAGIWNSITDTFTGTAEWWEVLITVVLIVLAVVALIVIIVLLVKFFRWARDSLFQEKAKSKNKTKTSKKRSKKK